MGESVIYLPDVLVSGNTCRPISTRELDPPTFWCDICKVDMKRPVIAIQHCLGKDHQSKMVKKYGQFPPSAGPNRKRKTETVGYANIPLKKLRSHSTAPKNLVTPSFHGKLDPDAKDEKNCKLCDIKFTSEVHAKQHYDGKRHDEAVNGYKNRGRGFMSGDRGGRGRGFGSAGRGSYGRGFGSADRGSYGRGFVPADRGGRGRGFGPADRGGHGRGFGSADRGGRGRGIGSADRGGRGRGIGSVDRGGHGTRSSEGEASGQGRGFGRARGRGRGRGEGAGAGRGFANSNGYSTFSGANIGGMEAPEFPSEYHNTSFTGEPRSFMNNNHFQQSGSSSYSNNNYTYKPDLDEMTRRVMSAWMGY